MPNLQVEGSVLFALSVPLWTAVRWARSAHGNLPSHRHSLQLAPAKEENPEVIAVLSYWFDGDASHNYKYKWFPSSSRDIQERADAAIAERFETCLRLAAADELGYWGSSLKANIAKILVLDQFSRHIYRKLSADASERRDADSRALALAELLVSTAGWAGGLSTAEFVFALMPFRHSSTLERLDMVLRLVGERLGSEGKDQELLLKFHKQTKRRYQALRDRARAEAAGDVVDHHYFAADETDILKEPLLSTVLNFLLKHLKPSGRRAGEISLAISLSGGVDSMVIAKILAVLRDSGLVRLSAEACPVHVTAIHIDYGNRPESSEEARVVEQYARDMLGLEWRLRHITEVTRGVTERSDYEKISRALRYGFYKEVLKERGCPGVIFGHHIGDVHENVISNVMRGCSSLYLSGMAEVGLTEGVAVWRPLLVHDKDDIYRFAHKYGVPYLQDSTPSWSTRGKLRQELLPILLDIYGTGCMHNLSSLAADSDAMRSLVQDTVFDPFLRSINRCDCGISVQITDFYRNQSAVFWAEALKQIMHSMSMSLVREKAVQNFVGRIHMLAKDAVAVELESPHTPGARRVSFQLDQRAARIMSGWLELRKGFNCFIDDNNTLCILRPGVLRPSGSAARQSRGKRFEGAAWGEPPCVEIAVSADCLPCSVVVVEPGSNGVELKLPLDLVAGDPLRLVAGSEISPPLQACLLDMRVCLTALTALNLGYPLSPRMLASTEPTLQRVSVSFSVEFGAWTISVRLTSSGQASFQVVTGRSTLIRPTSPESMVYSDGEQSDYEDDGIWKWSPGERSERKLSMPPEPEYEVLPLLTDIHDVLNGRFCYEFPVFHHNCRPALEENVCDNADGSTSVASVVHLQLVAGMTASGVRDLHIGSLRSLETKIREGLPLVCPVIVDDADSSTSKKTKKRNKDVEVTGADKLCTVTVSYSYTISNENRGHDMN